MGRPTKIDSRINPISVWMKDINLRSISLDEFPRKLEKNYFFLEKIDGELNCFIYNKNSESYFLTRSDMMRTDLLVLDEYKNILDNTNIQNITILGEGTAIKNNRILPFNNIQSILKTAYRNQEYNKMYNHHPYDILSINGKRHTGNWYSKMTLIESLFKRSFRIHPVRYIKGDIDRAWFLFTDDPGVEGLIARDHKNYKIKKSFTFDLVVVAVGNTTMSSWNRNQISYLKVAFMNKSGEFSLATNIGTGFTTRTREDLFDFAQMNKIEEKNNEIWIKPKLIVETRWLRLRKINMPTFKYTLSGYEYIGERPGYSLIQTSMKGIRSDKKVSIHDIGFRQIPENIK